MWELALTENWYKKAAVEKVRKQFPQRPPLPPATLWA